MSLETSNSETPGFDIARVESWVEENVSNLVPPFTWTRLTGGHSNLTFALVDQEGTSAVIRRPPEGKLLAKAHDMGREYKVICGLADTPVPVPTAYGFCTDERLTGANFYLMSMVEGRAMFDADDVEEWLDHAARLQMAHSFIDTLAALHAVDPASVGLDDLGRPDGYVSRQLRTWYGSWTASTDGAGYDDQRIHLLHELLVSAVPAQGQARVVHGDFGPHNCMVDQSGQVTAILDWEIATLGDPLADLAYALNGWGDAEVEGDVGLLPGGATTAPGFPGNRVLATRYADRTGADLKDLAYYRCFNYFKTACILHGVYARYLLGQKSSEGVDLPALHERMLATIERADNMAESIANSSQT